MAMRSTFYWALFVVTVAFVVCGAVYSELRNAKLPNMVHHPKAEPTRIPLDKFKTAPDGSIYVER
jgi:hypothetical protein